MVCINSGRLKGQRVDDRGGVLAEEDSCFAALRQIRSVRNSIPRQAMLSPVVSIVMTRLDYGSATLAGLPAHLIDRLQSVMNAAARLIFSSRKYDHVMPLLHELH